MSDVMDKRIEQKIMEVMRTNNQELLGSISGMISKISDKPSSLLDIPKFKRKSNEEQYKINSRVLEKIETAGSHVQAQNLTAAHEAIVQGKHNIDIFFFDNNLSVYITRIIVTTCMVIYKIGSIAHLSQYTHV